MEGKGGGEIMRQTIVRALEEVYGNLVHMIAEFLPRFLVMLIIIAIGLLAAVVLKYILRALLGLTKLDRVSDDAGASRVLRMAHLPPMTELLSRSIFWVTWIGFILVGLSVLGVAGLQEQISRLFQFLPEVFVAILILFLGAVIANFLSRTALLAAVNAGHPSPKILSWSIRFVIWILAISMTLEELGVARQTVISAFSIIFGASMLGLAIAFGLGGQDLARKCLERYLGGTKEKEDKEPQPL
jgi:small-conductance mechanosensitive channel